MPYFDEVDGIKKQAVENLARSNAAIRANEEKKRHELHERKSNLAPIVIEFYRKMKELGAEEMLVYASEEDVHPDRPPALKVIEVVHVVPRDPNNFWDETTFYYYLATEDGHFGYRVRNQKSFWVQRPPRDLLERIFGRSKSYEKLDCYYLGPDYYPNDIQHILKSGLISQARKVL